MWFSQILELFKKKRSLLIVEDDGVLRAALIERFQKEGYRVYDTYRTQEALTILSEKKPAALILDLILPVKDGVTLLEEVRSLGHTLPVLILSNLLGSKGLRDDAARLNATYFNKSSATLDTIVMEVNRLVEST